MTPPVSEAVQDYAKVKFEHDRIPHMDDMRPVPELS
jgi:hypothetical protein